MAKKKKIIYLIGSMRRGGAEGQVVHLARHFNSGKYECALYLLSEVGEHLNEVRALGVPIRGFHFEKQHSVFDPRTPLQVLGTVNRISLALAEDQPDILHCFLYWANVFGAWAGPSARVPRMITSRRSLGLYKDGRGWMQAVENWTNRRVDAVTVNSEAVRADTLAREKIDPQKIHLIYNGVPFEPPASETEAEVFLGQVGLGGAKASGTKTILCVANLIHYKGHLTLIDALKEVAAQVPDFRLLLVGRDGGMEERIRQRAAESGLKEKVLFLGSLTSLARVYAAADVVVHPSDEEGFSNVILEAMAAGRAIVATRVGGIPEAISDGEDGLLVPKGDAHALADGLLKVLRDDALQRRLGLAARERALREFSMEAMFRNYEKLYEGLLR